MDNICPWRIISQSMLRWGDIYLKGSLSPRKYGRQVCCHPKRWQQTNAACLVLNDFWPSTLRTDLDQNNFSIKLLCHEFPLPVFHFLL